jgi:hypothetical protein
MKKQIRWKCEQCGHGLLAPSRPRKNDVRRYCLTCSAKRGILVERVAPALQKKSERKQTQRKQLVAKRRERVAVSPKTYEMNYRKYLTKYSNGWHIQSEAKKIWNLFEPYHKGKQMPTIKIWFNKMEFDYTEAEQSGNPNDVKVWKYSRGNLGHAEYWSNEIMLKTHCDWETLAHELCHMAVRSRYEDGRRKSHDEVFYKALKDVCERRWKKRISFHEVTKYGYAVDYIIEKQIAPEIKAWQEEQAEKNKHKKPTPLHITKKGQA